MIKKTLWVLATSAIIPILYAIYKRGLAAYALPKAKPEERVEPEEDESEEDEDLLALRLKVQSIEDIQDRLEALPPKDRNPLTRKLMLDSINEELRAVIPEVPPITDEEIPNIEGFSLGLRNTHPVWAAIFSELQNLKMKIEETN